MPENAWMCLPKQDTEYALGLKIPMPIFWIWQGSENGRVLNMRALHSVLNMPEYAVNVSCSSSLHFWICIIQYTAQGHSTSYNKYLLRDSEPSQRSKMEHFEKTITVFNYFCKYLHLKSLRWFWICVRF